MDSNALKYTKELYRAMEVFRVNNNGRAYYEGKEGALRLAREYGVGLCDSPIKERLDAMRSSYSILCVRFYDLKPPIDNKEWIKEIQNAIKKQESKINIGGIVYEY